jgi:serine/threonine protein phosphatase 1
VKYYQKNKIPHPIKGRRFVIGDIHGCFNTFRCLLEKQIIPTLEDHVYLLGDYIDKGPDSKKTLNYIIKLIKKGFKVYPLRGNHEQDVLDVAANEPELLNWLLRKSPDLLKNGTLRKKHIKFLNSLPYYYELPDFYLVHGGFNFEIKNPFKDTKTMLWRRMPSELNAPFADNKTIIHGHQPIEIDDILDRVLKRYKIIGLDNGVNYIKTHKIYEYTKMGNLCALNLDTFKLYVQKNCEVILENKPVAKRESA